MELKQKKGITLIALVVTIIVLIILAGVSISLVLGDNGIITKAKQGKEDYIKAQLKEELETKILELEMERVSNGKEFQREDLFELSNIGALIDDVGIPATGEYKDYEFTIDENNEVTIGEKFTGEAPKITLTKSTEEIVQSLTIAVTVVSADGEEVVVTKPDGTTTTLTEFQYPITENGTYEFIAKGSNSRKTVARITITNTVPTAPVINVFGGKRVILAENPRVEGEPENGRYVTIDYDVSKGVENYYSEDFGANWKEYTGRFITTSENVMAKSINAGIEGCSSIVAVSVKNNYFSSLVIDHDPISNDELVWEPHDKDLSGLVAEIEPSCWGKKLRCSVTCGTYANLYCDFLDSQGQILQHALWITGGTDRDIWTSAEIVVPERSTELYIYVDGSKATPHDYHWGWVYEIEVL